MTTADLLAVIARDPSPVRTIGSLSTRAGTTRREIESAIQNARLEGVPVITDGGIRVATTAAEAFALHRWLRHRLATQNRTAWAVRSQAMLMDRAERAEASRAVPRAAGATLTLGLDVAA